MKEEIMNMILSLVEEKNEEKVREILINKYADEIGDIVEEIQQIAIIAEQDYIGEDYDDTEDL